MLEFINHTFGAGARPVFPLCIRKYCRTGGEILSFSCSSSWITWQRLRFCSIISPHFSRDWVAGMVQHCMLGILQGPFLGLSGRPGPSLLDLSILMNRQICSIMPAKVLPSILSAWSWSPIRAHSGSFGPLVIVDMIAAMLSSSVTLFP